jgi:hypothetical protein
MHGKSNNFHRFYTNFTLSNIVDSHFNFHFSNSNEIDFLTLIMNRRFHFYKLTGINIS